ncbi:MAG: hypothetical protein HQL50_03205 [Magnetococcales bacterium]|nr:hypothetical protein [Magnetococcales bacterium]
MAERFISSALLALGLGVTAWMGYPDTVEASEDWRADDLWTINGSVSGVIGDYDDSNTRGSFYGSGLKMSFDYLDRGGFTLGYNYTHVDFKDGQGRDLDQAAYYASGRLQARPDGARGTVIFRMDTHLVDNDDITGTSDGAYAVAPIIGFYNYDKSLYLDLGLTRSFYMNDFRLMQLTPTVGFGFNEGSDWLQLRGFLIDSNNRSRSQGEEFTAALDIKYSHWFAPGNLLKIDQVSLGGLVGDRIHAVDPDAASMTNLSDVQTGSASISGSWRLGDVTNLTVLGGGDFYENVPAKDSYRSTYFFLNLSREW